MHIMRTVLRIALSVVLTIPLAAQNADLGIVSQTSRPGPLIPGDLGNITTAIQNLGPDRARNLRVEYTGTPGVIFTTVRGDGCTLTETKAVCVYDDFPVQVTYSGADYTAPLAAGTHTVTATVLSDATDPNPSNNSTSITVATIPASALDAFLWPQTARLDPGQSTQIEMTVTPIHRLLPIVVPAGTTLEANFSLDGAATITAIDALPYWNCNLAGATATCTAAAPGGECCGKLNVTIRADEGRTGGAVSFRGEVKALMPGLDSGSSANAALEIFRIIGVTSTADAGPGSLREAIADANAHCATLPCRMFFEIPPPVPTEGWFTITPETPLPPLRARQLFVDALASQTRQTGDTHPDGPEVVIDGRHVGEGIEVHGLCDGSVRGLGFRNFQVNYGLWVSTGPCVSPHVEIEGNLFEYNLRGLHLDDAAFANVRGNVMRNNTRSGAWMWSGGAWFDSNRIEDNGASGIFFGPDVKSALVSYNTIARNQGMGLAVASEVGHFDAVRNSMRDNGGIGIDWGIDGVTPQRDDDSTTHTNAPTMMAAVYAPATNDTRVTLSVRTRHFPNTVAGWVNIELFANDSADGDGEAVIYTGFAPDIDGAAFTVVVKGDHRGKWINATATRAMALWAKPPDQSIRTQGLTGDRASTSELSNTVRVVE